MRQAPVPMHLGCVTPAANHLEHGRARVQAQDLAVEESALAGPVDDDPVAPRPPDLSGTFESAIARTSSSGLRAAHARGSRAGVPPISWTASCCSPRPPAISGNSRKRE